MKKLTLPLVVLGAISLPALAQSNVAISGFVAGGFDSYRLTNQANEARITDQASRILFTGSEDLGGGLKAFFQIDNRFAFDTGGSTLATGNTGVGLSGSFGKVTLGRWDMHYNEGTVTESARALSEQTIVTHGLLAQVNGTKIAMVSRSANQIRYDSPSFNGFNGTLAYAFNPAGEEGSGLRAAATTAYSCATGNTLIGSGATSQCLPNAGGATTAATATTTAGLSNPGAGGAWQATGRYANGPINAGLSYWNYTVEGDVKAGDQRSTRAWFSYAFPFGLKAGLVLDQSKLRGASTFTKRTAWALPLSYAFGNHAAYLVFAKAGNVTGTSNTDANQWVLGYDYALSKRTVLGANYTRLTNDTAASYDFKSAPANSLTGNGQDARQFYLGVKHSF